MFTGAAQLLIHRWLVRWLHWLPFYCWGRQGMFLRGTTSRTHFLTGLVCKKRNSNATLRTRTSACSHLPTELLRSDKLSLEDTRPWWISQIPPWIRCILSFRPFPPEHRVHVDGTGKINLVPKGRWHCITGDVSEILGSRPNTWSEDFLCCIYSVWLFCSAWQGRKVDPD